MILHCTAVVHISIISCYITGDALGERFISALSVRRMQRTFPSSAFLIPYAGPHFWDDDFPFVITPKRNYSISNLPTLAKVILFYTWILGLNKTYLYRKKLSHIRKHQLLVLFHGPPKVSNVWLNNVRYGYVTGFHLCF